MGNIVGLALKHHIVDKLVSILFSGVITLKLVLPPERKGSASKENNLLHMGRPLIFPEATARS